MSDERLYGKPGDEYMESSIEDCWEYWWDGAEPADWEADGWSLTIEEWSVVRSSARLIGVDLLLENIVEWSFQDSSTEEFYESMFDIVTSDPEVRGAMMAALHVIGDQVDKKGWWAADKHLRDHTVTYSDGRFLLNGEPTDWEVGR